MPIKPTNRAIIYSKAYTTPVAIAYLRESKIKYKTTAVSIKYTKLNTTVSAHFNISKKCASELPELIWALINTNT